MSKPFSDSWTVRRNDQIISGDVDGETVMMSIDSGNYHSLNATGNRIWELLADPCTVSEIIKAIEAEYHVEDAVVVGEIYRFLEKLLDRNLIRVEAPENP